MKEKLFVQRSQQRGQARNIIWNCRAIHLCWTEPVLLFCLLCVTWRGVFGNRGNSASSPQSLPCALAEMIPLSRSWLFLPWQESAMIWGEKLPQCRARQSKKPKGKYRKGGSTKKDCRIPENMNTYFMHFCSDCYKWPNLWLRVLFPSLCLKNTGLPTFIPFQVSHSTVLSTRFPEVSCNNIEWSFHKASSNIWVSSEVKIDINENQSFQRGSDSIKEKVPSKPGKLLFKLI